MAFNEQLGDRIREALVNIENVEEKLMFGGLCFMVDNKMCVGVVKDEMMCRIDPAQEDDLLLKEGARPMDFTKKRMKGYIYVDENGLRRNSDFVFWINACLNYNPKAKSSKEKKN